MPKNILLFKVNLKNRIKALIYIKNFLELSKMYSEDEHKMNTEEIKENLRLIKEIRDEYKEFCKIDALDFSDQGEKNWLDALNKYTKKIENIENKINNTLENKLAQAKTYSEQYKIFKNFHLYLNNKNHLYLYRYQDTLVVQIIQNLSYLLSTLINGYKSNTASQMTKIKGIPEVSGKIIWLKQFPKKANAYKKKVEVILGNDWEKEHYYGDPIKVLIKLIEKYSNIISRLVDDFNKKALLDVYDDCVELMNISEKQGEYAIKINFFNYDQKNLDTTKEVRFLLRNNFPINGIVIYKARELKEDYYYAIAL